MLVNLPLGRGNVLSKVKDRPLPDWAVQVDATSFTQLFLKYVVSRPAVTVAIPGTTKVGHLEDNLGAARGRLPDADMRRRIETFLRRAVVHNACAHAIVRHDAHRSSREDV